MVYLLIIGALLLLLCIMAGLNFYLHQQHQKRATKFSALNKFLQQENSEYAKELEDQRGRKEWYRRLFNDSEDIVFVYEIAGDGMPGKLLDVNDVSCAKLGYSREELLNLTPLDIEVEQDAIPALVFAAGSSVALSHPNAGSRGDKYASQVSHLLVEKILQEKHVVYCGVYANRAGRSFPVEVNARRLDFSNMTVILCTAHDITNRQEAQNALNESEQRFKNFFAHSPIGVAICDAEKHLVDANLAYLRIFGAPNREELQRFSLFDNPFVPVDARAKVATGESVQFEMTVDFEDVRKNSMFVSSKSGQANLDVMIDSLGHDRNFKTRGYIIQVQDTTQRRKTELALRQSEKLLRQAEKMEALGSMAGGIAHDFNNILTPLLGYTEIALRSVDTANPVHMYLQEILKASHRAKELVEQILSFSRKHDKEGQAIHILPIVKEVINLMRSSMPEKIEVRRVIKTDRDIVFGDATQMHQVFMNICTNAAYAMRDMPGGVLEIVVSDFLVDRHSKGDFPDLQPGRYIRISVKDTGTGIDQAIMDKVFEPFFTTKPRGEGTGLGLSVVHNIIAACKGRIAVESELGKGSTFHVVFPLLEDQAEARLAESSMPLPTGKEHIMIVDDEADIVEMIAHMLASLGYHPVLTTTGTEALGLFQACPSRYDAIIADQVMPGKSGSQLAKEIRSIRSDVPVILVTGFSETLSPEELKANGISELLKKPVIMRDLAEMVRRVLDSRPTPAA